MSTGVAELDGALGGLFWGDNVVWETEKSHLAPGERTGPSASPGGVELIAVATGLVQVFLPRRRPVLRQGGMLLVERGGVTSWRNVGDADALLFRVLRDDAVTSQPTPSSTGGLVT